MITTILFYLSDFLLMNRIFKVILTLLLVVIVWLVSYEAYHAYMMNHTYYYDMMSKWKHRQLIFEFIGLSLIVLRSIFRTKTFKLRNLGIAILISIILWSFFHTGIKGGLANSTGAVIFFINMVIILAIISILFGGMFALGSRLFHNYLKEKLQLSSINQHIISLWIWLWVFLLVNYVLIFAQVFYPLVVWIEMILLGYCIRKWRHYFTDMEFSLSESIQKLKQAPLSYQIVIAVLISITVTYILYSFNLAYIPYSTAWDANHAYMYYPKVRSLHHWLFFSWWPSPSPYLWMSYIAVGFSLLQPFWTTGFIAPDTLAIILNSISWHLSLLFWIGALSTLLHYFKDLKIITSDTQSRYALSISRWYFLMWLMSGMGAFLVFVDNKTDLWVMSLTMLALMTGFVFIHHLHKNSQTRFSRKLANNIPALLSGFFFSLAIMSKPTAFQDAAIFLLFLVGIFVGILWLLGLFFLLLAVLGKAETMSMVFYISKQFANRIGAVGLLTTLWQVLLSWKKKLWYILQSTLYRWGSILVLLLVFKGSYLAIRQNVLDTFTPSNFVKWLLLGSSSHTSDTNNNSKLPKKIFLADTGDDIAIDTLTWWTILPSREAEIKPEFCSLETVWLTKDTLYDDLKDIEGGWLTEDLLRYIWFWQRKFTSPQTRSQEEQSAYWPIRLGYTALKLLTPGEGCYGFNKTAKALCEEQDYSLETIHALMDKASSGSNQYLFLQSIIDKYSELEQEDDQRRKDSLEYSINQSIIQYVEWNILKISYDSGGNKVVAIPYAFLTPINVVFNRSLQNRSSYYTDIGFVRIISYVLLFAGLIYSIAHRQKELIILHLATFAGRCIWRFLASGIIRYAIGIIARTIFANSLFLAQLFDKEKIQLSYWLGRLLLAILVLIAIIQTCFNLVRMSSQWGSWPFVWYKWHVWRDTAFLFDAQWAFGQQEIMNYNYNAKSVFDVQFGHYNPFLDYVADRENEHGVLIAWTYLQYFLQNQYYITSDGLLTKLWQRGSDNNICALDLRLENQNISYIVIDPNIWSVVMWEWNASLFDRFIAKIDSKTNTIIQDGAISLLSRMVEDNYLKLIHTSNIAAKYAYTLTDEDILSTINSMSNTGTQTKLLDAFEADPILFRSKLAVTKFFQSELNDYFSFVWSVFQARLWSNLGLEDLADMLGKSVSTNKLLKTLSLIDNPDPTLNITSLNVELSSDERTVLGYYLVLKQRLEKNDIQASQSMINELLQNSIMSSSQLITFERLRH